jgi:exodeoxyribonuclease-5
MTIILNSDQSAALSEIMTAYREKRARHLLTGYAGTGKTTLMQSVVTELRKEGARVVVTAPTHKAVQVLRRKMDEAGISVPVLTIHSLLGLKPAPSDTEKTELKRNGRGRLADFNAVVIDECSMIGSDLQAFIDQDLLYQFVLYVGDPAQLPPVGEEIAPCLKTPSRSHLERIVRQAEGNPILQAASALRKQQGSRVDWGWCVAAEHGAHGVYLAGDDATAWMRDAFTSDEFKHNNDAFRYVCYTNARVHEVNRQVRQWIYGDTLTPFVPGELVLTRAPILTPQGKPAFQTNEEIRVGSIERGEVHFYFEKLEASARGREIPAWETTIPTCRVKLDSADGNESVEIDEEETDIRNVYADIPVNPAQWESIDRRLVSEAKANYKRWYERFTAKDKIADLRCVYALTAHTSQGSTFDNVFVDVRDCSKLELRNPLEMQKLLYVAVTRPRNALVLVGTRG